MDCFIFVVYLYEIVVWCCYLFLLVYDSVQKWVNFLMNFGCLFGVEVVVLVGGDDLEVCSLVFF